MLIVVNYHYVRPVFDAPYPGIHGVTPAQLETQLRLLGTAGSFVSGLEVREAIRGRVSLPERALLVTFDDGLREQYEHALPVLQRLRIPALFFVNTQPIVERAISVVHMIHLLRAYTPPQRFRELLESNAQRHGVAPELEATGNWGGAAQQYRYDTPADARLKYFLNFQLPPERREAVVTACFRAVFENREAAIRASLYMDVGQLQRLGERHQVGTHGHKHVPLAELSRGAVAGSVTTSLELLTAWLGYRPYALSYPYGSYDACATAAEGVAAAGVECAFTMERAANRDLSRPLHLARFDCNDLPGGRAPRFGIEDVFERVNARRWHGMAARPASRDVPAAAPGTRP